MFLGKNFEFKVEEEYSCLFSRVVFVVVGRGGSYEEWRVGFIVFIFVLK